MALVVAQSQEGNELCKTKEGFSVFVWDGLVEAKWLFVSDIFLVNPEHVSEFLSRH